LYHGKWRDRAWRAKGLTGAGNAPQGLNAPGWGRKAFLIRFRPLLRSVPKGARARFAGAQTQRPHRARCSRNSGSNRTLRSDKADFFESRL